ncbi:hypothetical protein [Mesorhizobium sp. LNJC405B00]|uniref:hypothetical protein n=1 Tax=Mesorhizobium sp. LNJC405B00 TaxID=1287281 RepID=UPI0003CEC82A|nr:hypothetical protein [Mesorhizobium sp. LNJC405B00]ESX98717.1 hypothetical protein X755_15300 [Mesorhizobium sp. LNJC405B00]
MTRWIIRDTRSGMFASVTDRSSGVKGLHVNSHMGRAFNSRADALSRCREGERPFPYFIPRTYAEMRRAA